MTKRETSPSRRVAKASRLWSDTRGCGLSSAQSGSVALRGAGERGLWTAWNLDNNGTREAAVCLVAASRLPYELTVDLIYAGIRQGSRTMINDELKLWIQSSGTGRMPQRSRKRTPRQCADARGVSGLVSAASRIRQLSG